MNYKINVSDNDIIDGFRCDASECPITLAVRRLFPHASTVITVSAYVRLWFDLPDRTLVYKAFLPRSASRFMHAFDNLKVVVPFNFIMNLEQVNA